MTIPTNIQALIDDANVVLDDLSGLVEQLQEQYPNDCVHEPNLQFGVLLQQDGNYYTFASSARPSGAHAIEIQFGTPHADCCKIQSEEVLSGQIQQRFAVDCNQTYVGSVGTMAGRCIWGAAWDNVSGNAFTLKLRIAACG